MIKSVRLVGGTAVALIVSWAASHATLAGQQPGPGPRFEIAFSKDARAEPVTGMVYVAISRDNQRAPIQQTSPTGVPLF